jgi:hypothetical protein
MAMPYKTAFLIRWGTSQCPEKIDAIRATRDRFERRRTRELTDQRATGCVPGNERCVCLPGEKEPARHEK